MTTLGAENTYNIKYTLASEDDKVLHGIEIDDMGEHFIESADEDLATFKMDWPDNKSLCWGRVTEHPNDNDYFYTVTDGTSLNITSGLVIESLEIDRLPLVGWDCWTNMDTVNNIFNMLDSTYTVTIGDYTFNMIDDKAHLAENIEQFKKALSKYGSKKPDISNEISSKNSVYFSIKNNIIDYKQVFPILQLKSYYNFTITQDKFLYKLQNIWNRVVLGMQSYFDPHYNSLVNKIDFNLDLCNKLKRDTLTIAPEEDYNGCLGTIDGKYNTVIKKIFITSSYPDEFSNFSSLEYIEQTGKPSIDNNSFACVMSEDAKAIKYIIHKDFDTNSIFLYTLPVLAEQITIDRIGGLPESSFSDLEFSELKEITLTNITEIGNNSFVNIPNSITKIELPNTLLRIGSNCFSLVSNGINVNFSITIPESVTEIGENAFLNVPKIYYKGTATGAPWGAKEVITEF